MKRDGRYVLLVTQSDYIQSLTPGRIARQRARGDEKLTAEELQEFRSCCGALQWVVCQSRPDGAATVSLSNRGCDSSLDNLRTLYSLMGRLRRASDCGLVFRGLPLGPKTLVVSYGDCSWANAQDYKSQEGLLACLTTEAALEGPAPAVLVDWKSTRTPRVVRSTLAGEAYAADAIDRGVLVNQSLCELIFGERASPVKRDAQLLRHLHATDCKSLYDAAIAANFQTEEKRVGLTLGIEY